MTNQTEHEPAWGPEFAGWVARGKQKVAAAGRQTVADGLSASRVKRQVLSLARDPSVKAFAVATVTERQARRRRRAEREGRRPAPPLMERELRAIVRRLDVRQPCLEGVVHYRKRKLGTDTYRDILNFGIENRTRQQLVRLLLGPQLPSVGTDRVLIAGSPQQVTAAVRSALGEGYTWAQTADIADCFPSFRTASLADLLPLADWRIVRNVIASEAYNIQSSETRAGASFLRGYDRETTRKATVGLPQGAATSNLVARQLLGSAVPGGSGGTFSVLYVDDLLVLGRSHDDVSQQMNRLRDHFGGHPAGSFGLRVGDVRRCDDGFDYLKRRYVHRHGVPSVMPTADSYEPFLRRLEARLAMNVAYADPTEPEFLDETYRCLANYAGSMKDTDAFALLTECEDRLPRSAPRGVMHVPGWELALDDLREELSRDASHPAFGRDIGRRPLITPDPATQINPYATGAEATVEYAADRWVEAPPMRQSEARRAAAPRSGRTRQSNRRR